VWCHMSLVSGAQEAIGRRIDVWGWAKHQWVTPVILATQEAEIRRTAVQSQPRQIVCKILSQKSTSQKSAGGGSRCRPWVQALVLQKKEKTRLWVWFKWQSTSLASARSWVQERSCTVT
jgi:hypothetical protein